MKTGRQGEGSALDLVGAGGPFTPDWLHNELTIGGPAGAVARFRDAAAGPGWIPWALDLDHEETRLLAPMAGVGIEARLLARELRETIAVNHARALTLAESSRNCPFDLLRLIPVPDRILAFGPHDPAARAWLCTHWGTAWPLRQVRLLDPVPDRRLRRSARLTIGFVSADWSPWQALLRLRQAWPELILVLRPRYGDD